MWVEQAYEDHASAVLSVAAHLGGREIADDVTQEVFLRLWRGPEKFDAHRGSLRAFLTVMTRSVTIDMLRANGARRSREDRAPLPAVEGHSRDSEATSKTIRNDVAARLRIALQTLELVEREAIVLAFYGGLSYREVARVLNAAEGTVKSRIRTGLRRLASHVEPNDVDAFST